MAATLAASPTLPSTTGWVWRLVVYRAGIRGGIVRKALMVGVAVFLGLSVLGMPGAFAVTKSPGLLHASDLPGRFQLSAGPTAYASPSAPVVTASACTETTQVEATALGGVSIAFARVGAAPGSYALIEGVVSFPNAKAAAKEFALESKSHRARMKCGTLGFIPLGSTTAKATTTYQSAKFPKIGGGSFYESSGTPGTVNTNAVVAFVSGAYIVRLGTFGGTHPLTITDFKTIAPRALKRLPIPTPIPATTTTLSK